ncbi:MAG: threonine synthase [Bacteroidaceae bacterium]|nr:threonine synthase [Bacteroidaceae bacterium]
MLYYSTNQSACSATLREAVVRGLAEDRGLYMPEVIKQLPQSFFEEIGGLTFQEVAYRVADAFFGEDLPADELRRIVNDTLQFDIPLVRVDENIYALELFHGPTLAFKDVGARFMARLLQYFISQPPASLPIKEEGGNLQDEPSAQMHPTLPPAGERRGDVVNVLVATSGDTGSAVANGFLGVESIHVYVLYPKGKVSAIQECQFTTLGRNITAIEVDGVFDDCQRLVKSAFMDEELNAHMRLTSANSINVARFLPQAFYYFWAYAQASRLNATSLSELVVCVPSGNFGNLCSALFGHAMGLPLKRFIAANNANDVFYQYLQTGIYAPQPSKQTIANAMDVGAPSNFARILDLYGRADVQERLRKRNIVQPLPSLAKGSAGSPLITGATYTDEQIAETMRECYARTGYVLDPHGACGYRALREQLQPGETGIFLETAHPAKFKQTVDSILGTHITIPERLQAFMRGQKQSIALSKDFSDFKAFLLRQ